MMKTVDEMRNELVSKGVKVSIRVLARAQAHGVNLSSLATKHEKAELNSWEEVKSLHEQTQTEE